MSVWIFQADICYVKAMIDTTTTAYAQKEGSWLAS